MRALLALALVSAAPLSAQSNRLIEHGTVSAPIRIQLDAVPTSSLVTMLLRDVMRVPYVIAPDVLSDRRPTSVRLVIPRDQVPERVVAYLRRSGFSVQLQGGTVFVGKSGNRGASSFAPSSSSVPFGSPVDVAGYPPARSEAPANVERPSMSSAQTNTQAETYSPPPPPPERVTEGILAFIPAHRDPGYFSTVAGPLLEGVKFGARDGPAADRSQPLVNGALGPDVLVMTGPVEQLAKARKLVALLDRPRPQVAVKAVVMQVRDERRRGSALGILASFANGKVRGGSYAADPPASQFVRIGTGALSAVLSAVREDSRFRVVATPNLTALSGAVATMNSGAQVPTVGSVVVAEGGAPVQSVEYRDSGITLEVKPTVRGDLIELEVREERSTFVRTATGVNDTPTLEKSSANASVTLKSGESIVLAGLTEQSSGNTREGLLGGILGVRSREKTDAELLVLIQAELVPLPVTKAGTFIDVHTPEEDDNGTPTDPLAPALG